MKTLKRAVAGSFFALSLLALPAATVAAQQTTQPQQPPLVCLCVACGAYHVVVL